jgi:stress-induced morphogen
MAGFAARDARRTPAPAPRDRRRSSSAPEESMNQRLTCDDVRELITRHLPGASVEVRDLTGTSDHFDVAVTAETFRDKSLIEQHRLVHAAVRDYLGDGRPIHALQIKTVAA